MNRRQFAVLLPVAALAAGCKTEPEPVPATPLDPEKVGKALDNLSSKIGELERETDAIKHGDWSKYVPKIEDAASDVRIAYEHLRQALGMPTA